jgi:hypothetical protein
MHRKKRELREVLTALEMDSNGWTGRQRRTDSRQTCDDLELKESRSWCLRTERGREMGIRWG